MKKKAFLANPQNKQRFISLLGCEWGKEKGKKVTLSSGDANFDIVKSACILAQNKPLILVGDDTDVLILLQHHFSATEHETIYLQTSSKIIDISVLKQSLTPELSQSLLFIHALSGCDTTSRPFGIGKQSALAKYQKLQNLATVFTMADRSHEEIEQAGNKALVVLYGCTQDWDLNFERASKFTEKVASSSRYLPPERLPPTSDAARFHSQRVYHQVQVWLGNDMEPTDWGWTKCTIHHKTILKPKRMEQAAAPASLLNIIKCNCGGMCNKNTCSCRKNGLQCTLACGHCKGITCTNSQTPDITDNDD